MASATSDLSSRFLDWFKRLAAAGLLTLPILINPVPASRPRVGKWGTYYGKKYTAWKKQAEDICSAFDDVKLDGPIAVFVESVIEKPKTSRLEYPAPDVDNLCKGPLDAITKGQRIWNDDKQIVVLVTTKRWAEPGESPATNVYAFPVS